MTDSRPTLEEIRKLAVAYGSAEHSCGYAGCGALHTARASTTLSALLSAIERYGTSPLIVQKCPVCDGQGHLNIPGEWLAKMQAAWPAEDIGAPSGPEQESA